MGCSTRLDAKGPVDSAALFAQLGKGEKPSTAHTAQGMAGDVIAVMDHAKIRKAHLIGASAGATVSGWLASKRPERVSSLALLMANSGTPLNPMPADPVTMASVGMPPATDASIEARRTLLAAMNKAPEADEPTRSPEVRQQVA
ncbi:alpha/beta fold hydrolase [Stenotrophomonas sp. Y-13]|uniref:alpha/beta fold hydrolase n=1 Tax=Stenotrophomonas sp. Y-13 TaxID=3384161 RepID=UPI0039174651